MMSTSTTMPLTTAFTAPSSCSTSWTYEAETYNGVSSGLVMQNAINNFRDSSCFPSGFDQAGRAPGNQVFSPGICPHGYATQNPTTVVGSITTATCCYSDFTLGSMSTYIGCISTFSGSTIVAARAGGFTTLDSTLSTSISGVFTMWALPIVVAHQATDSSLYTTTTSTGTQTSSSSSATSTALPTSSGPPPAPPASSPRRLSAGAKAGIGVGAAVGALFIVGIMMFMWRRMQKNKLAAAQHPTGELEAKASPPATELAVEQANWRAQNQTFELAAQDAHAPHQN